MSTPFDPTNLSIHGHLFQAAIDAIEAHAKVFDYDPLPIFLLMAKDYARWWSADPDHAAAAIQRLTGIYRASTAAHMRGEA